jgi:hypothetical protein
VRGELERAARPRAPTRKGGDGMQKLKTKIKRLIFMAKAWWKSRRYPKPLRKAMFWHAVNIYDTQEYLKTLKHPMGGEILDFAAELVGIKRNGMSDAALRAKITETVTGVRKEARANAMRADN